MLLGRCSSRREDDVERLYWVQVSYKSYWIRAILEVLHAGRGSMMSIQDVSNVTGIHPADVREAMGTLQLTQCAPASLSITPVNCHLWVSALPAFNGLGTSFSGGSGVHVQGLAGRAAPAQCSTACWQDVRGRSEARNRLAAQVREGRHGAQCDAAHRGGAPAEDGQPADHPHRPRAPALDAVRRVAHCRPALSAGRAPMG